ncbi:sulfatase-like hydrolase/transferase [Rhizobium laguerreae]|uniref:sulfatase-like hydrolase/transferase n=1 Tax=Rhizobium laguerreae TaxID=1076926 RepID=UPI001C91F3BC|nr:sulfatase-like hydrolase/transferase [Rhizobium laguerreae]MBY3515021.1 sulfatase-like hydrolase/transferase [Rhizobium laguerreae]
MRLLTIASGLLIATVLCFAVPRDFYFGNTLEFPLRFSSYLPLLAGAAVAIIAVAVAVAAIAPRAIRKWVAVALGAVAVLVYVNAMAIGTDVGTLTGKPVAFNVGNGQLLAEVAIFVVAAVILAKARKFASMALFILAAGNLTTAGYAAITESKENPSIPDEGKLYSMGDKNLLVVLLDGFPSDVFGQIIKSDGKHKAALDGFTYFDNMAAISATTYLALPSIHGGAIYHPGQPLRPYFTDAVGRNSFLTRLAAASYDSVLVNPMLGVCPDSTTCYLPETLLTSQAEMRWTGALTLLGVSVFRAAPAAYKEAAYNQGSWAFAELKGDTIPKDHNVEGIKFLDLFSQRVKAGSDRPTAKFLHVLTPHLPVVLGDGCVYTGGPIPALREAFVRQAGCALEAFEKVASSLKEAGLYDKTTIVLLADHGQAIPSIKADVPGEWQKLSGWANPMFAVKPAGSRGEMKISTDSLWLPDIPVIICRETGDCGPKTVAKHETRTFNYYDWKNEYWNADSIPVAQYTLNGVPWLKRSWSEVRDIGSVGPAN